MELLDQVVILFFFNFYFYFILLYDTVLVLPYIDMNPPRVYMGREVGGGFRIGNTCTPVVDSC